MAEAERTASVVTAVGLNLRCHRLVEAARAIVASGTLGPIATLRTTWTAGYERGRPLPEWRRLRDHGGGVLYEIGTHHVDLWRHLLGEEIDDVGALCRTGETEDETAVLTGRASGGAIVTAVLSDQAPDANEVDIIGRDGRLRFSLYRGDSLEVTSREPDYRARARARALGHRAAALPTAIRAARTGGDFVNSYARSARARRGRDPRRREPARRPGPTASRRLASSRQRPPRPAPRSRSSEQRGREHRRPQAQRGARRACRRGGARDDPPPPPRPDRA